MESYEVGILTFWNVPNYGTFIQAYALQKVLNKILTDKDVRQIAHLDKKHYNFYYSVIPQIKCWKRGFWKELISNLGHYDNNLKRKEKFQASYKTIPHTIELNGTEIEKTSFGAVVIGSDIVWDYTINVFNNDPYLFGVGLNANTVLSYAASFGTVKLGQALPEYVKKGLQAMKYISVRDENSADIVESVCGKRPTVVLDPVWLWDFEHDDAIITPQLSDYIVVYGQDFTKDFIQNLINFARKTDKKLVCLDCNDDYYDWCDVLIKQQDLTPYQWVGVIKGADYVATSTFHGLTFGLVFKKKIAFCKTPFIIDKVGGLLKELNLFELFQNESEVERMFRHEWDYLEIDQVINKKRKKSLSFLEEAMSEIYE